MTEGSQRRFRVFKVATWIAALVCGGFGVYETISDSGATIVATVNLVTATLILLTPLLWRFSDIWAVVTFVLIAFSSVTVMTVTLGTDTGLQFYLLVAASLIVLVLGPNRFLLAGVLVEAAAALIIYLQFTVPGNTGAQPEVMLRVGFVSSAICASLLAFATVWYSLREISRADAAMRREYARSEQLLANILPASVAERLKNPDGKMIADRYDDASILFADIAGFTERASETAPCDLVEFLDRLYTDFDTLVDRHGLEKIKTTGDSYMVVSGVPEPRPDHLQALAALALDMANTVAELRDPQGRPVPIRIGMAVGPVVAGVVGARRFFYDVWGDAVNVAARMETTDTAGRIQVPEDVYQRLRDEFEFEERGDVAVKGKGVMHTWFLVSRQDDDVAGELESDPAVHDPGAKQDVLS